MMYIHDRRIDMLKNANVKNFSILFIVLLITADLAIFFDIPLLRQIFGFIFLAILPGFLILMVLRLDKIGLIEKFVLSIGLSASFLMIAGLLINGISLSLGYQTPLERNTLLISFNLLFIVLAIFGSKTTNTSIISLPIFKFTALEKIFLLLPIMFPVLSIFGIRAMNQTNNNFALLVLILLILAYIVLVCIFNEMFSNRLYPFVILSISISLLLLAPLRSDHIIGADTHVEYFLFQTTLDNLNWRSSTLGSVLDACLSISLLPAMYNSIMNINREFLYKILYPLLFSISPLIVYSISRKYVGEPYAFLASCFFMFQSIFLLTTINSRTSVAILFFALAMMSIFNDKIDPFNKKVLLIIFTISCMISHYSTTYIFFIIILGAFFGAEVLSKRYTFDRVISSTLLLLFFALIFVWYSQVTGMAFNYGVIFITDTFSKLNEFFIEESLSTDVLTLLGKDVAQKGPASAIDLTFTWLTFVFIAIGIIASLIKYKEVSFLELNSKKPDFLKEKFMVEFGLIALVCCGLLVAIITIPYVSVGYGIERLYLATIPILSVFFVIGGIILSELIFKKGLLEIFSSIDKAFLIFPTKQNNRKDNVFQKGKDIGSPVWSYLIILSILIPFFLCSSGVVYNALGSPRSIILNSEGIQYDLYYVGDQDSYSTKWLSKYGESPLKMYADHYYGYDIMISQGKMSPTSIGKLQLYASGGKPTEGYIYLREPYYRGKSGAKFGYSNIGEISKAVSKAKKIYDNDELIYKVGNG